LDLASASHGHPRAAVLRRLLLVVEIIVAVGPTVLIELAAKQAIIGLAEGERVCRAVTAAVVLQVLLVLQLRVDCFPTVAHIVRIRQTGFLLRRHG